MSSVTNTCQQHFPSEMSLLGIYCLLESVQLTMCVISLKQLSNQKEKSPKSLRISQWIFYLSALTFSLCRIPTTLCFCFALNYYTPIWFILSLSYVVHLFGLLLILFSRLKFVFINTQYSLNRKTIYTLWLIFIFLPFATALANALGGFGVISYSMVIGIQSLMILIFLVTAQFLAWSFVYKLFQIKKKNVDGGQKEMNDTFLKTIKKYSVLSVVSVMFTTLYAVVAAVGFSISVKYYISAFLAATLCVDVFIDTMCMTLSLKVNAKYYKMICLPFTSCSSQHRLEVIAEMSKVASVTLEMTNVSSVTPETTKVASITSMDEASV